MRSYPEAESAFENVIRTEKIVIFSNLESQSFFVVKNQRSVKAILLQILEIEIGGFDFLDEFGAVSVRGELLFEVEAGTFTLLVGGESRSLALVVEIALALFVAQSAGRTRRRGPGRSFDD